MLQLKIIIIIIVTVILFSILIIICFRPNISPKSILESKFNLSLPSTSKIIKFDYNSFNEDIAVKVQFSKYDLDSMQKELSNYFGDEYDFKNNEIPFNGYGITWWDVEKSNIYVCYEVFSEGKKHWFIPHPKTLTLWAFIVNKDHEYYLYIAN